MSGIADGQVNFDLTPIILTPIIPIIRLANAGGIVMQTGKIEVFKLH